MLTRSFVKCSKTPAHRQSANMIKHAWRAVQTDGMCRTLVAASPMTRWYFMRCCPAVTTNEKPFMLLYAGLAVHAGKASGKLRDQDVLDELLSCRAHDTLMLMSSTGRAYAIKAHKVPEASRAAMGTPIAQVRAAAPCILFKL